MKKKYTSEDSYYARMNNLAGVKKTQVNESGTRNMGTLIDIERAANGVAYGIVKEQHKYYIKKGGLNENLDAADFAYIGGLGNVTDYEYSKLAEARKNRNMMLKTINEGLEVKPMKSVGKKTMIIEGKAEQEIEKADSKLGDLDAATDAAAAPPPAPEIPADDGAAEMDAGLEAMGDAEADAGGAELDAGIEATADGDPELGDAEMGAGDAEIAGGDAEMGADPLGDEVPADDGMGSDSGEEVAVEDPETEMEREIVKMLGKVTNNIRKTELTDSQVKSYVNTFLSAFKDKFPDIDIEDRKEMAEKITKVVPPEDIEDLEQSVEDAEGMDAEITATEPEEEVAEQQCAECGGFAQYAESRGYNADSIKECGEEEMTNMVSGYANAHGEGQNDGDFKAVALFITPEILEKLRGEYGHDEYANQVEPFSMEMNECSAEMKEQQIDELFGGLKHLGQKAGQGIKQGVQQAGQAVKQAGQNVAQGVQQAATNVKQTYHAGEKNAALGKLEKVAAELGQKIAAVNKHAEKSGEEPINVKSILSTISNQVAGAAGTADLSKFRANEEEGIPVDSVEVMPPMEEEVDIKVSEKKGKPLSAEKAPEVEMKESEEKEGEDIEIEDLDVSAEEAPVEDAPEDDDDNVLDLTKPRQQPNAEFGVGFDPMGGGVVKPESAEITTVEVTKDSVKVEMNESEVKLRKYIRNRLEEKAGLKKPSLNESKKSDTLKKLDRTIDKQFELYESVAIEEVFGWSLKEKFQKLDPNDAKGVGQLFYKAFQAILNNPQMGTIFNAAKKTSTPERYAILQQYVEAGGGTLRLGPNGIQFASPDVKNAATKSQFSQGGTQGKTQLGGI